MRLRHVIFSDHARDGKSKGRGLHHVDNERDDQGRHQRPMCPMKRRVLRRDDRDPGRDHGVVGIPARQESVARGDHARDDEIHAKDHAWIHRHAGQDETVAVPHPEHWDMQEHAGGDAEAAQPKSLDAAPIEKNLSINHLPCPPPALKSPAHP